MVWERNEEYHAVIQRKCSLAQATWICFHQYDMYLGSMSGCSVWREDVQMGNEGEGKGKEGEEGGCL